MAEHLRPLQTLQMPSPSVRDTLQCRSATCIRSPLYFSITRGLILRPTVIMRMVLTDSMASIATCNKAIEIQVYLNQNAAAAQTAVSDTQL